MTMDGGGGASQHQGDGTKRQGTGVVEERLDLSEGTKVKHGVSMTVGKNTGQGEANNGIAK